MERSPQIRLIRWRAVACGLLLLLIGLVVADGAYHRAADATKPIAFLAAPQTTSELPETLRIASFNIHSGKGRDGIRSLSRTANLLADVDLVGLYEVRGVANGQSQNQASLLAESLKLGGIFAPTERQWWSDHFGNGLLFKWPIQSYLRIPLVNTRGKAFRNAILSTVAIRGAEIHVIAVHIDRETDRRHQLKSIIELFLSLQQPCVLMGDLNTTQDDPLLSSLKENPRVRSPLHEHFSDQLASQTIDWIFTRGLKSLSASLIPNDASDHPVLKAELVPESIDVESSPKSEG